MASEPPADAPVIGITMGDPLGIGPEVVAKALAEPSLRRTARFVVYGINRPLAQEYERAGRVPDWSCVPIESNRAERLIREPVLVLDHPELDQPTPLERGPSRPGGLASKTFVEAAITDAQRAPGHPRRIDAVVTAPISKASWHLAGYDWPGHTELFAARTKVRTSAMMFVSPRLRVVLATTHVPLMALRDLLTIGRVYDPIDLGHRACRELGIAQPRIAVTGLNPHASEGGQFGDEESRVIAPAIDLARRHGIDARGPFPADTIFIAAAAGEWDLVVAMYHDQGLIPVKLLGWDRAVNWTIGLPIIRTSPDHGTAWDIAGKGRASAGSMIAAIELATMLARRAVPES